MGKIDRTQGLRERWTDRHKGPMEMTDRNSGQDRQMDKQGLWARETDRDSGKQTDGQGYGKVDRGTGPPCRWVDRAT